MAFTWLSRVIRAPLSLLTSPSYIFFLLRAKSAPRLSFAALLALASRSCALIFFWMWFSLEFSFRFGGLFSEREQKADARTRSWRYGFPIKYIYLGARVRSTGLQQQSSSSSCFVVAFGATLTRLKLLSWEWAAPCLQKTFEIVPQILVLLTRDRTAVVPRDDGSIRHGMKTA